MKPQQLMDLPYAGDAEQYLKSTGEWLYTDEEKLQMIYDKFRSAYSDIGDAMDALEEHT